MKYYLFVVMVITYCVQLVKLILLLIISNNLLMVVKPKIINKYEIICKKYCIKTGYANNYVSPLLLAILLIVYLANHKSFMTLINIPYIAECCVYYTLNCTKHLTKLDLLQDHQSVRQLNYQTY